MAAGLDAARLATAIKNDTTITADIPAAAIGHFNTFIDKLAVHIVDEMHNGAITDVQVNTGTGTQTNTSLLT